MDNNSAVKREAGLENIPIIGFMSTNSLQTLFIGLFGDNRNLGILKFYGSIVELYRKKIPLSKSFTQIQIQRVIRKRRKPRRLEE